MALAAPRPEGGPDPFELERLAEELELREKSRPSTLQGNEDDDDASNIPNLPAYEPLSHDNKYLSAEDFDVERFLLSRSHTTLPDLRSELREYLASLKEELVKLINDDYEAFISLSTDLQDEGTRLDRLKHPLNGIRTQILVSSLFLMSSNSPNPSVGIEARAEHHSE